MVVKLPNAFDLAQTVQSSKQHKEYILKDLILSEFADKVKHVNAFTNTMHVYVNDPDKITSDGEFTNFIKRYIEDAGYVDVSIATRVNPNNHITCPIKPSKNIYQEVTSKKGKSVGSVLYLSTVIFPILDFVALPYDIFQWSKYRNAKKIYNKHLLHHKDQIVTISFSLPRFSRPSRT